MHTRSNWWLTQRQPWWWPVALALVLSTLPLCQAWSQEQRTALVIGNSGYAKAPLLNPVNDAQAMAQQLSGLGFAVTKLENASQNQMASAIQRFGEAIKRGGVGLFYFAGHGIQVNGENFLIPVDADIQEMTQITGKGVAAKLVLQQMNQAKNRINFVILDACRNNPFRDSANRGLAQTGQASSLPRADHGSGLAPMEALVGTLIAFATAPDSVAADGAGQNGVYTDHLLRNMREPGLRIEEVFKRTRFAVRQETGGRQVPWENTSLEGDFFFIPPPAGATASPSGRVAALPPDTTTQRGRPDAATTKSTPNVSGFSFSREEAKDRMAQSTKTDEIRARLQTPCADTLRRQPIFIDITEESRADGLSTTERSSQFAQLVQQHLQQAGLTPTLVTASGRQGQAVRARNGYAVQGVVLSSQGTNRIVRVNEASLSAELVLRDPAGRIVTMVEVAGESFAGQDTRVAARALSKEQASEASSQLYAALCSSGR